MPFIWIYSGILIRPLPVLLAGGNPLNHSLVCLVIAGVLWGGGAQSKQGWTEEVVEECWRSIGQEKQDRNVKKH